MTILYAGYTADNLSRYYDTDTKQYTVVVDDSATPTQAQLDAAHAAYTYLRNNPITDKYEYTINGTEDKIISAFEIPLLVSSIPGHDGYIEPAGTTGLDGTFTPTPTVVPNPTATPAPTTSAPPSNSSSVAAIGTLTNYIANLKSRGLPTASHYFVQITGVMNRESWMMCDQVSLPGLSIATADLRTYGEVREAPWGVIYQPINLQFILDNSFDTKVLFERWINQVYDRTTRTAGYYSDYVKEVNIYQTNADNKVIYGVKLYEAFPKSVLDVNLGYDVKDVVKLNVTMVFKYWAQIDEKGNPTVPTVKTNTSDLVDLNRRNPVKDAMNVNSPPSYDVGPTLIDTGSNVSIMCGVASSQVAAAFGNSTVPNASGFSSAFSDLTGSVGKFGSSLTSLGQNLQNVVAPLQALRSSTSAIAGSLGSINSLLGAVGMGSPLGKTISNLNNIAGQLGQTAGMNGVPSLISSVGANFGGVSNTFNNLSTSFANAPGATKNLLNSLSNVGSVFGDSSTSVTNAGNKLSSLFGN